MLPNLNKKIEKISKPNVLNSRSKLAHFISKVLGFQVFEVESNSGVVIRQLCIPALIAHFIWITLFTWITYQATHDDQTIVRAFYDTKLKMYGDSYERITSFLYVLFLMWQIPFKIGRSTTFFQILLDFDNVLEDMGVDVDYNRQNRIDLIVTVTQIAAMTLRFLTICGTLMALGESFPYAKLIQVIVTDGISLILSSYYFIYLKELSSRYKCINNKLLSLKIENRVCFRRVFVSPAVTVTPFENDSSNFKDTIRECSRLHSMLYKESEEINRIFGPALVFTLFLPLAYIIINFFYFLEATARGLFNDAYRYSLLLGYLCWGIAYNGLVLLSNVYFSEITVAEAKHTAFVVHELLHSDLSQDVADEAMKLSSQMLVLIPKFTAMGLVNIDYPLLMEASRFIITFMGLLLQFAT